MSPIWKRKGDGAAEGVGSGTPPIDLDVPVTNEALLDAITAFANRPGLGAELTMQRAFARAVFLVAAAIEGPAGPDTAEAQASLPAGSSIELRAAVDPSGRRLLAVCSDWDALRRWTGGPTQGLVLPAADAWDLALRLFDGVLLNPAGPFLELDHARIRQIQAHR